MAINVEFYSFSKRINSTKRPDSGEVTYSCNMINGFSLTHPVLQIAGANNQFNPTIYNYARIADFNDRYYFVEDWKYDKGLWTAYLTVDELASWKLTIGTTTQFVTRCEHANYWKKNIVDIRFKPTSSHDVTKIETNDYPFLTNSSYGCYLVRTLGGGTNLSPVCVFDGAEFGTFTTMLKSSLGSEYENALSSILMCRWLPFQKHNFNTTSLDSIKEIYIDSARKINLGFSPSFVSVGGQSDNLSFIFNINKLDHPQVLDYGKSLNNSLYTKCEFVWHPVGVIPLDCSLLYNASKVEFKICLDVLTGFAIFTISANGAVLFTETIQFGYEMPLSLKTVDYLGITRGLITGVASIATGNLAGAALSGISVYDASIPKIERRNGGGGFMYSYTFAKPFLQFDFTIVDPCEDNQRFGKPSFQQILISNLYGYIQCENADFKAAGATKAEITAVNNYMNGGFYYE